jgi:hypothetical protein
VVVVVMTVVGAPAGGLDDAADDVAKVDEGTEEEPGVLEPAVEDTVPGELDDGRLLLLLGVAETVGRGVLTLTLGAELLGEMDDWVLLLLAGSLQRTKREDTRQNSFAHHEHEG